MGRTGRIPRELAQPRALPPELDPRRRRPRGGLVLAHRLLRRRAEHGRDHRGQRDRCKMLSGDRLAQQLNVSSYDKDVTCSSVNEWAVELAEMMAFSSTLDRYKKSGRGWCFLKDVPTFQSIGPLWVFKDALALKDNSTCMSVASPILKTTIDGKIYPGNHCCKFLSPARVLDWMMTDSLKPGK